MSSHRLSSCFFLFFIYTDKNQYVHRRDSVSLRSLSEQEIQRRIQLGFVTPSLNGTATAATTNSEAPVVTDQKVSDDWQDITDQAEVMQDCANGTDDDDDPTETEGSMDDNPNNPYLLDTRRRSSVDLGHLSFNVHDESALLNSTAAGGGNESASGDHQLLTNKRLRYRQPSIASISEEEQSPAGTITTTNNNTSILMDNDDDDDDEVATVDGNDDEDIMEDA